MLLCMVILLSCVQFPCFFFFFKHRKYILQLAFGKGYGFSCLLCENLYLLELSQELSITEKYNSKRQNEAGAEESDDVAVIYHVG